MSLTLFTPQAGERMGPGYPLQVTTDLVGPIPQTATWLVSFFSTAPGTSEGPILSQQISAFSGQHTLRYTVGDLSIPFQPSDGVQVNVNAGEQVRMVVELRNNALVLDQTSVNVVWDPAGRLFAQPQTAGSGQGGFTATDRATLTTTEQNTDSILAQWANYTSVTLPTLDQVLANIDAKLIATVLTMTGPVGFPIGQLLGGIDPNLFEPANLSGGVTCTRVDVDVSFNALYGVGLRISEYPADWVFRTPDNAWSFRDLAVLSFWRSGGLVERHGIHALTHSVSPVPDSALFSLGPIFGYLQPGDYHITVDWAEGVCGELFGMVLP